MHNHTIMLTCKKSKDSVLTSDFNWFQHGKARVIASTVPGGLCVIISLNKSPYK